MKVLVTGGAGFQGSHLVEHLVSEGHSVSVLNTFSEKGAENLSAVKDDINLIWGSVTDPVLVERTVSEHEVIFHLAAKINVDESIEDPSSFVQTNIVGTFNILEAARKHGARVIYASSCEVYGDGHNLAKDELLSESSELRPNSPYAASKVGADRLCHAYYKSYGLNVTMVRPFNIYGERQKGGTFGALIPIFVQRALDGQSLEVKGDGSATRDYMHVSDIVRAYDLVLNHPDEFQGEAVNFATGKNTSVKDIAEFVAKAFSVKITYGPARPGEVTRFPADKSALEKIGFKTEVDIWEGIYKYIDWAKSESLVLV